MVSVVNFKMHTCIIMYCFSYIAVPTDTANVGMIVGIVVAVVVVIVLAVVIILLVLRQRKRS